MALSIDGGVPRLPGPPPGHRVNSIVHVDRSSEVMKRVYGLFMVLLIVSVLVAGCDRGATPTVPPPPSEGPPVTITDPPAPPATPGGAKDTVRFALDWT